MALGGGIKGAAHEGSGEEIPEKGMVVSARDADRLLRARLLLPEFGCTPAWRLRQPLLHRMSPHAMVPPPLLLELAEDDDPPEAPPAARPWVRVVLVGIACGWLGVFGIAAWLNPYKDDGRPLRDETHRQLGLPECNFKRWTGVPCPSCGMTTSFALLVHGDLANSLRANFAGTLLALIGMLYIPWALLSMWRGHWVGVRILEPWLIRLVFAWVAIMLLRWAALLAFR
jgi:hypothetical protein